MKKYLSILLIIVFVLGMSFGMTSCGGGDSDDGTTTINLWHIFTADTDFNKITTEDVIADFEASHENVKVEVHILQDADYKTKMLTEFSGTAENVDVFTYWGAGRAGDLVEAGKILCLEDYLTEEQMDSIKEGADNNLRYDDKLYGLPLSSWMMFLYCNTELFDDNNVDLPETYDEWLAACKTFTENNIIPISLGGGVDDGWQAAFVFEALANRIVGSEAEMQILTDMSGFADNPGFKEAAEKMVEMTDAGAFGNSPLEIDEETSNVQFLTGASAMRLTGSWFTQGIYTEEDSVVEGKVQALPVPMVTGGNGLETDYVGGFIDGVFANAETKNPELVAEFTYALATALSTAQHENGEGFTAYNIAPDESNLSPLGVETGKIADTMIDGVVAWDTFLPGDLADIHIDACQSLLAKNADIDAFLKSYEQIFE